MKIQSNGMGMQSVAMYLMSSMGELPRFDYSIFADPGAEDSRTYEYLDWLNGWIASNNGIKLIHDKSMNLHDDIVNKWGNERIACLPLFSKNGGMMPRQCTNDYKINVVNRQIRKITKDKVQLFIGISLDEMQRVFKPNRKYLEYHYPFCNLIVNYNRFEIGNYEKMTRGQIIKWFIKNKFKIPVKSSCVFCPFHNNNTWRELKKNNPKDWDLACKIDERVRSKPGMQNEFYLHRSCQPLSKAYLQEDQTELNFDCYGFCDV